MVVCDRGGRRARVFTKEVTVVKGDTSKAVLRGPNMHLGRRTDQFLLAFSQVLTFTAGLHETRGFTAGNHAEMSSMCLKVYTIQW